MNEILSTNLLTSMLRERGHLRTGVIRDLRLTPANTSGEGSARYLVDVRYGGQYPGDPPERLFLKVGIHGGCIQPGQKWNFFDQCQPTIRYRYQPAMSCQWTKTPVTAGFFCRTYPKLTEQVKGHTSIFRSCRFSAR